MKTFDYFPALRPNKDRIGVTQEEDKEGYNLLYGFLMSVRTVPSARLQIYYNGGDGPTWWLQVLVTKI